MLWKDAALCLGVVLVLSGGGRAAAAQSGNLGIPALLVEDPGGIQKLPPKNQGDRRLDHNSPARRHDPEGSHPRRERGCPDPGYLQDFQQAGLPQGSYFDSSGTD